MVGVDNIAAALLREMQPDAVFTHRNHPANSWLLMALGA